MPDDGHTLLYCKTGHCHSLMVVIPGQWHVVRELGPQEHARPDHGSAHCGRCQTKWEYTAGAERRKAA